MFHTGYEEMLIIYQAMLVHIIIVSILYMMSFREVICPGSYNKVMGQIPKSVTASKETTLLSASTSCHAVTRAPLMTKIQR